MTSPYTSLDLNLTLQQKLITLIRSGDCRRVKEFYDSLGRSVQWAVGEMCGHITRTSYRAYTPYTPLNHWFDYYFDLDLDRASDTDLEGFKPLIIASKEGFEDIVSWLLENGANVHATDNVSLDHLLSF